MPRKPSNRPIPCEHLVDPRTRPFTEGRSRGDLYHLHKDGCTYFVTFCLRDAARRKALDRIEPGGGSRFKNTIHRAEPIEGRGSCILRKPEIAKTVENSLLFFQRDRYDLHSWVIMPNHVHVIVTPYPDHSLSSILHSWKSFSANEINRALNQTGKLWEEESFDHIIRDDKSLTRFADYIARNPVEAGYCAQPAEWPFGSARFE